MKENIFRKRAGVLLGCLFGHKWKRVSTQANGIGFLDKCEKCGKGRYLNWCGHGSFTGTRSREEMIEWEKEVSTNKEDVQTD